MNKTTLINDRNAHEFPAERQVSHYVFGMEDIVVNLEGAANAAYSIAQVIECSSYVDKNGLGYVCNQLIEACDALIERHQKLCSSVRNLKDDPVNIEF